MTAVQGAVLLLGTVLVVGAATWDRELRHQRRAARRLKRWSERHDRAAAEHRARQARADGYARIAASVTYERLDATPLPRRSELR